MDEAHRRLGIDIGARLRVVQRHIKAANETIGPRAVCLFIQMRCFLFCLDEFGRVVRMVSLNFNDVFLSGKVMFFEGRHNETEWWENAIEGYEHEGGDWPSTSIDHWFQ
jgi:hypothetical protein